MFGVVCVVTVTYLVQGAEQVVNGIFEQWHPDFVLIPAGIYLTTTMFYGSSAFIGHARRRQKAGELSGASTSMREDASEQPQTPRQQAMVGLIGTITAALIGLFGTLVTVFLGN